MLNVMRRLYSNIAGG